MTQQPLWPHLLRTVPWTAPWYRPYAKAGQMVAAACCGSSVALCGALNSAITAPVRFVPQEALPQGMAYEQFIFDTGQCPTREGAHDFFNGLCWSTFPATKRQLNHLQAAAITRDGIGATRGPLRDALTLFDENAAFLQAPDLLWEALAAKQWRRVFIDLRPLWHNTHLLVFGHALLEKLLQPRKGHTAHLHRLQMDSRALPDIDQWVAQGLRDGWMATKPAAHLPLLGVPGWCEANDDPAFYEDAETFRAQRSVPGRAAQ